MNQLREQVYGAVDELNLRLGRIQPALLLCSSVAGTVIFIRLRRLLRKSEKPLHKRLFAYAFSLARALPFVRRKIDAELSGVRASLQRAVHECDAALVFVRDLPHARTPDDEIAAKAREYFALNTRFDVRGGRVSGAVYTDLADDHLAMLTEIFKMYAFSNPLHPDVFPGCRKMEAEVVRMVANFFHGPPESCGTMTSGGTESIILACFASRNRALARGITDPVIVAPATAHAAFDKAAHLLGIRIRHVAVDAKTCAVKIDALRAAITADTCLLVGSAPNFPTGTVDDIPAIAELGAKYKIPVHVDACLGGFLVAFAADVGLALPVFDFRLAGVTSISCDTHKYGYAPKGTSTILYRSPEYLHHQYFSVTDWPGGIYATPTLSGSRAGLNIALTWATLLHFGRDGYAQRARQICDAAKSLADAVAKVPGIELVGRADVSVVAFRATDFNIYAVADLLNKRGWNLNTLQAPDSIHFCLTLNQAREEVIAAFVADLQTVCAEIADSPQKGNDSHTAGIYGMAATIPDKSLVDEVAFMYLDSCYSMPTHSDQPSQTTA